MIQNYVKGTVYVFIDASKSFLSSQLNWPNPYWFLAPIAPMCAMIESKALTKLKDILSEYYNK